MTSDRVSNERLAVAQALEEYALIDECEGGNPLVIATERWAAQLLRSPVTVSDEIRALEWHDDTQGPGCPIRFAAWPLHGYRIHLYQWGEADTWAVTFGSSKGVFLPKKCDADAAKSMVQDEWHNYLRRAALTAALAPAQHLPDARAALQAIADLPSGKNEDVTEGHEQAYRAVEALFTTPPLIHVAPTHPGGDSRVVAWRFRQKGMTLWSHTEDKPPFGTDGLLDHEWEFAPLVPLSSLETVERERDKWKGRFWKMDANFDRATTRAETAEASLAAALEEVKTRDELLADLRDHIDDPEYLKLLRPEISAALAGSNGE